MKETSARLLRLLTLLQTRREWSGAELADRLGVTTRTVRRDIDKLRDLDYPVYAGMGTTGGYRLGAGAELPPLLLDDEEAVAIAVGLRTATAAGVAGIGEASLRALVKLEQVLPPRLRHRVDSLRSSAVEAPGLGPPAVDAEALAAIGAACRDRQRLRFDYRGHNGTTSVRAAEPHELVTWGRRWYLVAWDVERDDWRTFRVDRMRPKIPTGPRFSRREVPGGDAAAFVSRNVAQRWSFQATLRLAAPADSPAGRAFAAYGRIEAVDADSCLLYVGADSPRSLTFLLGALEADFDVVEPAELADELMRTSIRFRRAADPAATRR